MSPATTTTTREISSYFLAIGTYNFMLSHREYKMPNYDILPLKRKWNKAVEWLLASVILEMAVCSIKTDSWASTRTRPGTTFSTCIPPVEFSSWMVDLFFPESKRNWSWSALKKSWNPSWTQSTIKSLSWSPPRFSSRSWRKSCNERVKRSKKARWGCVQLTWQIMWLSVTEVSKYKDQGNTNKSLEKKIRCNVRQQYYLHLLKMHQKANKESDRNRI